MGKHKLWLLPNLTEDCGFFESFQPWYTYEYCSGVVSANNRKRKNDGKKKTGIFSLTVLETILNEILIMTYQCHLSD